MTSHIRRVTIVPALLGTAWLFSGQQTGSAQAGCRPLSPATVAAGGRLAAGTCYDIDQPLYVSGGTLVVEPGVRLRFGANALLQIASDGSLNATGTAERPIVFTSRDAAQRWRGIHFDASRSAQNILHYVTIENGGSAGWSGAGYSTSALFLSGNTHVDVRNSTIARSGGQGLTVLGGANITFEDNTLRDNAVAAWVHPDVAGAIGRTTTFAGNQVNVVRVVFGNGDTVETAQTWRALAVPYEVQDRFFIDAPLTLDPGVVVRFRADASAIVQNGGTLTAVGTEAAPITLAGVEDLRGYWKGLQITTASARNRFDFVTFANGGSQPWTGGDDATATVYMDRNSTAAFTHCTFRGSGEYGLRVPATGDITGFDANAFTGNARAMIVHPDQAGAISPNNTFRDNGEDAVRVSYGNNDAVVTAQTWHDFNAPFYVMTRTFIHAPLTIAAGAELQFAQDASFVVNQQGALKAAGTNGNPVVFRGAEDLVGFWQGLQYGTASAGNALEHVDVSNAGSRPWFGGPNSTSAINVESTGRLALANVTFRKTGGFAVIVRGRGGLTCTTVDHGGARYYSAATQGAMATCPR